MSLEQWSSECSRLTTDQRLHISHTILSLTKQPVSLWVLKSILFPVKNIREKKIRKRLREKRKS